MGKVIDCITRCCKDRTDVTEAHGPGVRIRMRRVGNRGSSYYICLSKETECLLPNF